MLEQLRIQKDILASKSKIIFLKEKISYKTNVKNKDNTDNMQSEMLQALEKIRILKNTQRDLDAQAQVIREEIHDLKSIRESLLDSETESLNILQHLGSQKNEIEIKILELDIKIKEPEFHIAQLKVDILSYKNILDDSPPKPHYRVDGEYCMNGIHLCKNHPPRQVLENKNEIAAYHEKQGHARKEIARLQNILSKLLANQNYLKSQHEAACAELKYINEELQVYQTKLQNTQELLHKNDMSITQCQYNLQNIEVQSHDMSNEISTLQDSANYFSVIIENDGAAQHSVNELKNLLETEIEHLALLHIQLENLEQVAIDVPERKTIPTQRLTEDELEALALQQIMEEQSSGGASYPSFFNKARREINTAVNDVGNSVRGGLRYLTPGAIHQTATNVFMNQAELVSESPVTRTGDPFADRAFNLQDEKPNRFSPGSGQ